jgi:hypothetical protein
MLRSSRSTSTAFCSTGRHYPTTSRFRSRGLPSFSPRSIPARQSCASCRRCSSPGALPWSEAVRPPSRSLGSSGRAVSRCGERRRSPRAAILPCAPRPPPSCPGWAVGTRRPLPRARPGYRCCRSTAAMRRSARSICRTTPGASSAFGSGASPTWGQARSSTCSRHHLRRIPCFRRSRRSSRAWPRPWRSGGSCSATITCRPLSIRSSLSLHHVYRVPRCPVCSGLDDVSPPLPWHKEHAAVGD